MVKSLLIFLLVIAIIFTATCIEQSVIETTFGNIRFMITGLMENVDNITEADVIELTNYWEQQKKILHVLIPHRDIEKLDDHMSSLVVLGSRHDYIMALIELQILLDQTYIIPDMYRLSIENVF